jgi:hypothetical protein
VALDGAGKTATFGFTHHVHDIAIRKLINKNFVANIQLG